MQETEDSFRLKDLIFSEKEEAGVQSFVNVIKKVQHLPSLFSSYLAAEVYTSSRRSCGSCTTLRVLIPHYYCPLAQEIGRRGTGKLPFSSREVIKVSESMRKGIEQLQTLDDEQISVLIKLGFTLRDSMVLLPDFEVTISPFATLPCTTLRQFESEAREFDREIFIHNAIQETYELMLPVIFSGFEEKDHEKLVREKQGKFEEEINLLLALLQQWLDNDKHLDSTFPPLTARSDDPIDQQQAKSAEPQSPTSVSEKKPSTEIDYPKLVKILNEATFKELCKRIEVKDIYNLPTNSVARFPKHFSKEHLEELVIEMVDLSAFVLNDILKLEWPQLKKLACRACGLSDSSLEILAASKTASQLTSLDLTSDSKNRNSISYIGVRKITHSPSFANVKELILRGCRISTYGLLYLAESSNLTQLEKLDLGEDPTIQAEGFLAINGSSNLLNLKELILVSLHLGDSLPTALLMHNEKSQPKQYRRLTMVDCKLTALSLCLIFSSPFCTELRTLQLDANSFNKLRPELDICKRMKGLQLEELSLSSSGLMPEVLQVLLQHLDLPKMKELDLSSNTNLFSNVSAKSMSGIMDVDKLNLTNSGLGELSLLELTTFNKRKLVRSLNLSRNPISPLGMELVSCSNPFENLKHLQIWDQDNNLMAKLLSTESAKRLEDLNLVFNKLSQYAMVLWDQSNLYLNNLVTLDLSFNKIGNSGMKVLVSSQKVRNVRKLLLRFTDMNDTSLRVLGKATGLRSLKDVRITRGFVTLSGFRHFFHSPLFAQLELADVGEFGRLELLMKREILRAMLRERTKHVQIFYSFAQ